MAGRDGGGGPILARLSDSVPHRSPLSPPTPSSSPPPTSSSSSSSSKCLANLSSSVLFGIRQVAHSMSSEDAHAHRSTGARESQVDVVRHLALEQYEDMAGYDVPYFLVGHVPAAAVVVVRHLRSTVPAFPTVQIAPPAHHGAYLHGIWHEEHVSPPGGMDLRMSEMALNVHAFCR